MSVRVYCTDGGGIDPVCAFHGKPWSEHDGGRCLYCCLCFDPLVAPESCWADAEGHKWDVCIQCGEAGSAAWASA